MKKFGEVSLIIGVILIMILGASTFVFMGVKSHVTHYVSIEVNPKVEFLTNSKNLVTSFKPINEEAKQLLINEQFKGLKITDATEKFIDLCTQAGYIDVNEKQNAVKISILSGLNQKLELDLTRRVYKYFTENQIFGAVVDASKDLNMYKSAKNEGVTAEKYDLILAIMQNDDAEDISSLKKKSNKQLLKIIQQQHNDYQFEFTQEELAVKDGLILSNKDKYNNHLNSITKASTKEFREEYTKYLKNDAKKYEQNFDKSYQIWLENE